ncbi:MAG: lysozyme [Pseudomonadota bacterium]
MRLNAAGLKLIKSFEGWRGTAYRDPVGVWTIGYGHTSRAGPPEVYPGLKISRMQGQEILLRDLDQFAREIRPHIRVRLNDNQYSALLSFAYNVGATNFKRSSVLRFVNARRFSDVPARLMLWNRAGGRVLRGLTRRRAAEGALFVDAESPEAQAQDQKAMRQARGPVSQRRGKSGLRSSTNRAGIALFLSVLAGLFEDVRSMLAAAMSSGILTALLSWKNSLSLLLLLVSGFAIWWIVRERGLKAMDDGI